MTENCKWLPRSTYRHRANICQAVRSAQPEVCCIAGTDSTIRVLGLFIKSVFQLTRGYTYRSICCCLEDSSQNRRDCWRNGAKPVDSDEGCGVGDRLRERARIQLIIQSKLEMPFFISFLDFLTKTLRHLKSTR